MNISLDQARCFCALVEKQSYQAAAKELHRSHSAIVYAINCFEEQTGLTLLNRKKYRSTLTPEGQRIYQQCRKLLESASQLEQVCTELTSGWEPKISLVYDGVLSSDPFLGIFEYFKQQKIPTTVSIFSEFLHGVEKSFSDLEADFMISILQPKQANLVTVALRPIKLWLVAHRDHPIHDSKNAWTLSDLKQFTFFTVRGADRSLNLGTKELEEISTFHLADFSLKKTAILRGAGFGWLPEHLIIKEHKRGLLRPIKWEHPSLQELKPNLLYRKRAVTGRAGQLVLKLLK